MLPTRPNRPTPNAVPATISSSLAPSRGDSSNSTGGNVSNVAKRPEEMRVKKFGRGTDSGGGDGRDGFSVEVALAVKDLSGEYLSMPPGKTCLAILAYRE